MVSPLPMVGDDILFKHLDPVGPTACRARALFPNMGFHSSALAFASVHDRAIQYLEQAPVMIFASALRRSEYKRNVTYFRFKLEALFDAGAPLKVVMAAVGMPLVLRRLSGGGFQPKHAPTIEALKVVDPAILGRVIPAMGAQQRWLSSLQEWRYRTLRHRNHADEHFTWAVEQIAKHKVLPRDVSHVADFAGQRDETFNPSWQWPRAAEEAGRWHTRLNARRAVYGSGIAPDAVIDAGNHPDVARNDGYEFVALRTPEAIVEEGQAMRHCVATYVSAVIKGRSHIVSIRKAGARVATLELGPRWGVAQCKGKANAHPNGDVLTAADHYAFDIRKAAFRQEAR